MPRDVGQTTNPEVVEYIRSVVLSLLFTEAEEESVKRTRDSGTGATEKDEEQDSTTPTSPASEEQGTLDPEDGPPTDLPFPETITLSPDLIEGILTGIRSDDSALQLGACRQLLTPMAQVPLPALLYTLLDAVVDADLVGRLVTFLTPSSTPSSEGEEKVEGPEDPVPRPLALIISAAWVISTLARTDPRVLIEAGAIPVLISLLRPETPGTCLPATYALFGLASCEGPNGKRMFINQLIQQPTNSKSVRDGGIIPALIAAIQGALQEEPPLNLPLILALTKLAKAISHVPKNVRVTPGQLQLLKPLADICTKIPDTELDIIYHASWGLYYLTKSGNEAIITELVEESADLIPVLVFSVRSSLATPIKGRLHPSLSVLGNIVSSTVDGHTEAVLAEGLLPLLAPVLLDPLLSKEVNWIVSNVAAGNLGQKEDLFQGGFFPLILQVLRRAGVEPGLFPGAKEAIFTTINIMDKGSLEMKKWFLDNGILPVLVDLLREHPAEVLDPVRDSIYLLVKAFHPISDVEIGGVAGPGQSNLQRLLEESGTLRELSKYQEDDDDEVWERVAYILDVGLNNINSWHV